MNVSSFFKGGDLIMTSPHKRIFKMMETSGPCGPCEPCESMEVVEHQSSHDAEVSVLLSRRVADRQTDCLQHEAQQVCVMWNEITHRFWHFSSKVAGQRSIW